jgi:hypothetical protein
MWRHMGRRRDEKGKGRRQYVRPVERRADDLARVEP